MATSENENNLATSENENYLGVILLILEGGSYISKTILRRVLGRQKLDTLLLTSKSEVKRELHQGQLKKLYPSSENTDINTWDLQMLIVVILRLFHRSLTLEERKNLIAIKTLRNKVLTHSSSVFLNVEQYKDMIKDALTVLALGCDQTVQTECKKIIHEFSSRPLNKMSTRRHMKQIQDTDEKFAEVLKILEQSRRGVTQCENTSQSTSIAALSSLGHQSAGQSKKRSKSPEQTKSPSISKFQTSKRTKQDRFPKETEDLSRFKLKTSEHISRDLIPIRTEKRGFLEETESNCTSILEIDINEAETMATKDCKGKDCTADCEYHIDEAETVANIECKSKGYTEAAQIEDSDRCKIECIFRKTYPDLVSRMDPDLILDNVEHCRLLTYPQAKDLRQLTTTSEKNRKLIDRVRQRGKDGYTAFKDCLKETNQSHIVRQLECFETAEDSRDSIQTESKTKMIKVFDEPNVPEVGATRLVSKDPVRQSTDMVLSHALPHLVSFMKPDPILKIAQGCDLLNFLETRDAMEQKTTSQKNRNILDKVRQKGKDGYEKFKECLKRTQQSLIVELLECFEKGEELSKSLATNIDEKREKMAQVERLTNQLVERLKSELTANLTEQLENNPAGKFETEINIFIKMTLRGGQEKVITRCEEELNNSFNNRRNGAEGNVEDIQQPVNELLADIEKGGMTFIRSERKCILLVFECKTYAAVLHFLNFMASEQFRVRLDALADSLKRKLQIKDELYITAKIQLTSLEMLQDALEQEIAVPQKQQNGDYDSKVISNPIVERTLKLNLECSSSEGLTYLLKTFKEEKIGKHLNEISKTFASRYSTQVSLSSSIDLAEFRDALETSCTGPSKDEQVDCVQKETDVRRIHETLVYGQKNKTNQTAKTTEDKAYIQMKNNLRHDLIKLYRKQHATTQLSPLIEKEDAPLLEFYVKPEINSVNIERVLGEGKEVKTKINTLDRVFYKDKKDKEPYSEIYITADAGFGKTSFSKRLALSWCQAFSPCQKDEKFFLPDEVGTLLGFDFVFLIFLRDSSNDCFVDEQIWNQLFQRLPQACNCDKKDLENVLNKERCLVILDGLDEWTHPSNDCHQEKSSIPHRSKRKTTTIVTTTRPWKLSAIGLNTDQIDQKLEIAGFSNESVNKFKMAVVSHVSDNKDQCQVEDMIWMFDFAFGTIKKRLAAIPLLLMYILCLSCDQIYPDKSLFGLYCNIVAMLLKRTAQKYKNMGMALPQTPEYQECHIPIWFWENECIRYSSLLKALGQLAYETLFLENKTESKLAFDRSVAKQYLTQEWLDFCLKAGILTQNNYQRKLSARKNKISFAHKTVQEFFASLYVYSVPDVTSVPKTVLSKCKSLGDILEMSKFLEFISGFDAELFLLISSELMKIVNKDEISRDFIRSVDVIDSFTHPLKQYQEICVSCFKEMPDEHRVSLCLQDVFIDGSCIQDQYRKILQHLIKVNKHNIKSVYINMVDQPRDVLDLFALTDLENIEKLHYSGKYNDRYSLPLLNASIKCLHLSCDGSSWSRSLMEKVKSLVKLEAMSISWFKMSHSELSEFCSYVSQTRYLRQIVLRGLSCSDHWLDCPEIRLDLSGHSELKMLSLCDIPVSEIRVNMASLKACKIKSPSALELQLKFVNDVPVPTDKKITQTHVEFSGVELSARTFRGLVDAMTDLQRTVLVDMKHCTIEPKGEFERFMKEMKLAQHFMVLFKDRDTFRFKIIREGD